MLYAPPLGDTSMHYFCILFHPLRLLGATVLVLLFSHPAAQAAHNARVIVKFKSHSHSLEYPALQPNTAGQQAQRLSRSLGMALDNGRQISALMQVITGPSDIPSAALAEQLARDPSVEYAVVDERRHALNLPDDPLFLANSKPFPAIQNGQWYLRAADGVALSAINAEGAWDITQGNPALVVAVLDTGVVINHPDLTRKLLTGYSFFSTEGQLGHGWIPDASDPGDFTQDQECAPDTSAEPSSWHGTQTASLIGADTNNGQGMASVGRNVMLLPVRVLGPCGGHDSDIIAASLWAAGLSARPTTNPHPAKILNLSLGGSGACGAAYSDAMQQLTQAGVVVVAAAGNDAGLAVNAPANCPGVIAVSGVRHVGTKVGYSNVGPEVALTAPAGNCVNIHGRCLYPIITALNTGQTQPILSAEGHSYTNSLNPGLGTSFAAPLVAGTAALMLSINPKLTPAEIKTLLQQHARPFPLRSAQATEPLCQAPSDTEQNECYCTATTCGAGLLDAQRAVAAAAALAAPSLDIRINNQPLTALTFTTYRGDSLSLNSLATAVAPKTIKHYTWEILNNSPLGQFQGAVQSADTRLLLRDAGLLNVQLTVEDSAGVRLQKTLAITVKPRTLNPQIQVAKTQWAIGETLTLTSQATPIGGLKAVAYEWQLVTNPLIAAPTGALTTPDLTLKAMDKGELSLALTVTDNLGSTTTQLQPLVFFDPTPSNTSRCCRFRL